MVQVVKAVVLLLVLWATGGVAQADNDPFAHLKPKAPKAIEAMKEGNRFYRRSRAALSTGDNARADKLRQAAVALYQRSLSIEFSPLVAFNLGQVHRELGNYDEAITSYELFLASKKVGEQLRTDVRLRIAATRAEKAAAEQRRSPVSQPKPVAEPRTVKTSATAAPGRADSPAPRSRYRDKLAWSLVGAGTVLAITAGGFGISASGLRAAANREQDDDERTRLRDLADSRRSTAVVLGVGGAVLIAVGITKFVLYRPTKKSSRTARVGVVVDSRLIGVQGRF